MLLLLFLIVSSGQGLVEQGYLQLWMDEVYLGQYQSSEFGDRVVHQRGVVLAPRKRLKTTMMILCQANELTTEARPLLHLRGFVVVVRK